ncbi:MAG: hypothetical protein IJW44_01165 [Clostridia bacterium]|nr:hypothetical protein [Clostridia bacterium]
MTVVRDAVELVPPTALILYLEFSKKAIFKIDDFLSNFSCKTIQNRKKSKIFQGIWQKRQKKIRDVVGRVAGAVKNIFLKKSGINRGTGAVEKIFWKISKSP